ncbi:hypothetical protein [Pseudomonas siliginis]|uniref:hypothetical protein n=1 Tax=Pseudomonas siliginis TaxID=2842346 RepID=UPI002093933C|nr:hypothetical protein [Pseudomonas siliginis]UST77242.1 hypothetical protein NF676_00235 [Pseudomonas siliginis]
MKFKKTLQGRTKGDMPVEALLQHLQHLSRETVNMNTSSYTASALIVEQWRFDGEFFDVQFSQPAIEFLQATDDPRGEIVAVLFNEIG